MPPAPGRLILGRCNRCLRAATRRGAEWWHDPGPDCAGEERRFVPHEPFDPIARFWQIREPRDLYLDLPTMPRREAVSGARELLRRYTRAFDAAGIFDVTGVLDAAERARLTDDPDLPPFDGDDVSTAYAPQDNDESDVDDSEEATWRPRILHGEEPEPRPVSLSDLPPPPSPPEDPGTEFDDSPAPTTP